MTKEQRDEKYIQVQYTNGPFSCRPASERLNSEALGLNPTSG